MKSYVILFFGCLQHSEVLHRLLCHFSTIYRAKNNKEITSMLTCCVLSETVVSDDSRDIYCPVLSSVSTF